MEAELARIVRFKDLKNGPVYALMPYIQVNAKLTVPPPPDLIPLAIQDLAQQSQMQVEK